VHSLIGKNFVIAAAIFITTYFGLIVFVQNQIKDDLYQLLLSASFAFLLLIGFPYYCERMVRKNKGRN